MKALNKKLKITNFDILSICSLSHSQNIEIIEVLDNATTQIRQKNELLFANRIELQKLNDFAKLDNNWDSNGGIAPDMRSIEKAAEFIKTVDLEYDEEIYFVAPGPNGEISVEIHRNNKEIEIIFYPEISKYLCFENDNFGKQDSFSFRILPELIEWLDL